MVHNRRHGPLEIQGHTILCRQLTVQMIVHDKPHRPPVIDHGYAGHRMVLFKKLAYGTYSGVARYAGDRQSKTAGGYRAAHRVKYRAERLYTQLFRADCDCPAAGARSAEIKPLSEMRTCF